MTSPAASPPAAREDFNSLPPPGGESFTEPAEGGRVRGPLTFHIPRLRKNRNLVQTRFHSGQIGEVDQRSERSSSNPLSASARDATGNRGGGSSLVIVGGVTQPLRTALASIGPRSSLGGTSSATTLSRSTTRTVSPASARRTYFASLLPSTLRLTARISR